MLKKKRKNERPLWVIAVAFIIIGLMFGLIVAEYRVERFGEMVCRNQYGYHYKFTGFTDNGNSMHYGCQDDERDRYEETVVT